MMEQGAYNNLIKTLLIFTYKFDLDISQNLNSLKLSVANGNIDLSELKKEFEFALNNSSTDWHNIAKESELINNINQYSNQEIKDYISYLIFDFLFPTHKLSDKETELFYSITFNILSKEPLEWISAIDLFNKLKLFKDLEKLELFYLHHLKFKYSTFDWKYDENKHYQIGYYRIKSYSQV